MTTLQNRPNTALLVIDVQAGVVAGNHARDAVVANVATLVDKAREQDVPVVWVQHNDDGLARGSDEWQLVPELKRDDAEPLVEKSYGDSFEDTNLEDVLSDLSVGRLIVAGAQTDQCVRSTLHGALARGYDATLVSDAHTTEDLSAWGAPPPDMVIAHTNLYWKHQTAPGRTAGTVETQDVDFERALARQAALPTNRDCSAAAPPATSRRASASAAPSSRNDGPTRLNAASITPPMPRTGAATAVTPASTASWTTITPSSSTRPASAWPTALPRRGTLRPSQLTCLIA